MSAERVTLTDEERHGLWLREHAPIEATYTVVEAIIAARLEGQRAEIKADVLGEVVTAVLGDTVRAYNRGVYAAARLIGGQS